MLLIKGFLKIRVFYLHNKKKHCTYSPGISLCWDNIQRISSNIQSATSTLISPDFGWHSLRRLTNWLQTLGCLPTRTAMSRDTIHSSVNSFIPVMCNSFELTTLTITKSKCFLQAGSSSFLAMTLARFLLEFFKARFFVLLESVSECRAEMVTNCMCFTLDFTADESPNATKS